MDDEAPIAPVWAILDIEEGTRVFCEVYREPGFAWQYWRVHDGKITHRYLAMTAVAARLPLDRIAAKLNIGVT